MITPSVLALSSSRVKNSTYLEMARPLIEDFLGHNALRIAFIPFADVENNYEDYLAKVKGGLSSLSHRINVVLPSIAKEAIANADAIMVGGGNTFKLLHDLYEFDLIDLIIQKVQTGTPYIGWSAGANIIGLTIGTTNDMPVIESRSFKAFGFFPFQINPHYVNVKQDGHNGETRDERLIEFIKLNPAASIIALPEGTALQLKGNRLHLIGEETAILFQLKKETLQPVRTVIEKNADLSWML